VLEGLKSGNIAETRRKYEIAPNLYYRWKDAVEAGAKAALGGEAQPRVPSWQCQVLSIICEGSSIPRAPRGCTSHAMKSNGNPMGMKRYEKNCLHF